jgi:phosphatidylinositol-3-phosphatase
MSPVRTRLIAVVCFLTLLGTYAGTNHSIVSAASVPAFSHIFEIVMENHETTSIIGSSSAPYINSLAQQYGLATHYYGIRHPSLPNYLALTGGDTFGVSSDCTTCFVNAPNLVDQLESAGKSWKAYMESMPSPCFMGDSGSLYRQKHNPFIYFDSIRKNTARCNKIVPLTQLDTDLQNAMVPEYTWITPNMCNDMHDCSVSTGDTWLKTWVGKILASPAWQQNGALFITFDEGKTNAGCCTLAAGGQIVTLVISPLGKPAFQSSVAYDHYSLLRTIEEAWGLTTLANAGCACTTPMNEFFSDTTPPASATPTTTMFPTATVLPSPTDTPTTTSTPTPLITPTETITPTAMPVVTPTVLITNTFDARADTYISQANPYTSYRFNRQLQVVASPQGKQSFISFTVANLPADAEIVSATLRLIVVNDSTSGGHVYDMTGTSWPDTVTWNSRPTGTGALVASIGPVVLKQVVDVNVGATIHGNGIYSFAIIAPDGSTNTVGYASRENDVPGAGPSLVVIARTSTTAAPSETPSPTSTVIALASDD